MAWFLLLVIFWKPFYYIGMYIYKKYKKQKDGDYVTYLKYWFYDLWMLVWPREGEDYSAKR